MGVLSSSLRRVTKKLRVSIFETLFLLRSFALGIGAASFASEVQGAGDGKQGAGCMERGARTGSRILERGGNSASKDIAESPTALPERPKLIHNL